MLNRLTAEQQQQVMSSLQGQGQHTIAGNGAGEQPDQQPVAAPAVVKAADPAMPDAIDAAQQPVANNSLVATLMEEFDVDIDEPIADDADLNGHGHGDGVGEGIAVDEIGVTARDVSPIPARPVPVVVAPSRVAQGPFATGESPVTFSVGGSPGRIGGSPMRPGSSAAAADSEAARVASLSGWMHGSPAKVSSPRGTPAGPTGAAQLTAAELPDAAGLVAAAADDDAGGSGGGDGEAPAPPAE